jgi:signal transduction histidine kinase
MNFPEQSKASMAPRIDELQNENQRLRARLAEVQSTLEELENTVAAIRGGLVDAVVVERDESPEVWGFETSEALQMRLVLQAANAGTWEWNLVKSEVLWSQTLHALAGLPYDNGPKSPDLWINLIHPDDRQTTLQQFEVAIQRGQSDFNHEYRIVRADGAVRWVLSQARIVRSAAGEAERAFGINLDITERKLAEETLRQADRRKDEFLAMLAHELRNPLAAIQNGLTLARIAELTEEQRRWNDDMLDRQVGQLGRLIDDLLDMSRITQHKIDLKLRRAQMQRLLQRSIESTRPQIDDANHTLVVEMSEEPLWVEVDASRMEQIFVNLLTNAAKYTHEGGRLTVRLAREGQRAVVTVADTGIGIAPEMLPRVFDLFTQAEQGLDRSQGGLGIGLTLVRRLVDMHGGAVSAKSEGTGRGSEFTVRLPLSTPPAADRAEKSSAPAWRVPRKVMVVDDNRDAATALAMVLKTSGHTVNVAHSGREALEMAQQFQPQVVLLDLGLPEMNGFELAPLLRKSMPQVRLIAISGYGQSEDKARSKAAGFEDHLVKPARQEEVLSLLDSY